MGTPLYLELALLFPSTWYSFQYVFSLKCFKIAWKWDRLWWTILEKYKSCLLNICFHLWLFCLLFHRIICFSYYRYKIVKKHFNILVYHIKYKQINSQSFIQTDNVLNCWCTRLTANLITFGGNTGLWHLLHLGSVNMGNSCPSKTCWILTVCLIKVGNYMWKWQISASDNYAAQPSSYCINTAYKANLPEGHFIYIGTCILYL